MNIIKHEITQGLKSLIIWTVTIASFIIVCIIIFPDMSGEMDSMGEMFSSMGTFSKAFSLDVLNFGTLEGYYAIECGNILGIGGALFAGLLGISVLAKEEAFHTAEFLFSHPISRHRIVLEKAIAVLLQIIFLNFVVFVCTIISIGIIGENIFWKELVPLHIAFFLLQIVIASICFFFSSLLQTSGVGIGLGFALALYFLNIIAKLTENLKLLKYLTPFSFAESADIIQSGSIDLHYLLPSLCLSAVCVWLAFVMYNKKDLRV